MKPLNAASILPEDGTAGTLVGRVWLPQARGPAVVAVRMDGVYDVTQNFPTVSALAELPNPASALREAAGNQRVSLSCNRIESATKWASPHDQPLRKGPPHRREPGDVGGAAGTKVVSIPGITRRNSCSNDSAIVGSISIPTIHFA